jgi:hypothetical protein
MQGDPTQIRTAFAAPKKHGRQKRVEGGFFPAHGAYKLNAQSGLFKSVIRETLQRYPGRKFKKVDHSGS